MHLALSERDAGPAPAHAEQDELTIRVMRGGIRARGTHQREYLSQIRSKDLTFGIGPAGTGKTYLAVACAVEALQTDRVRRIVLVRPAVEAGERLGFLPGDLTQKVDPYLRPMYDALYEMMGFDRVARFIERNVIEVAPLAFMRGRTLNDAFVILDEAQNTTPEQMKMFLTRIGFGSRARGDGRYHANRFARRQTIRPLARAQHPARRRRRRVYALRCAGRGAPPARAANREGLRGAERIEMTASAAAKTAASRRARRGIPSNARRDRSRALQVDLQKRVSAWAPRPADIRTWASEALGRRAANREVSVRLVNRAESRKLNAHYRGKDYATNVLSFPAPPLDLTEAAQPLGDLVICPPVLEWKLASSARRCGHIGRTSSCTGRCISSVTTTSAMTTRVAWNVARSRYYAVSVSPTRTGSRRTPEGVEDPSMSKDLNATGRWLRKITQSLGEPQDREDLHAILSAAGERGVIDDEAVTMLEGVLEVADLQVRDIMVPRGQMISVRRDDPPSRLLPTVVESGHSRFPVMDEDRDDIIGILLAKDLLRMYASGARERFDIREYMRPAVFVPESKRLNVLLKEFRRNRNHMAIVIDEYGGVAGLVTIEDVIEQIIGEIDDEYDVEDDQNIRREAERQFAVRGVTRIDEFNEYFGSTLPDEEFDTVAGLIMKQLGRLPRRGESVTVDGFEFRVTRADRRRIEGLRVTSPKDVLTPPEDRPTNGS